MASSITLKVRENVYYATYAGDKRAEIIDLFGGDTIPTAFTKRTPASHVIRVIERLNPDCTVKMEG